MKKNNEIDLRPYFTLIYSEKKVVICSILSSILIGIVYILFSTQLYRSYTTLYPAGELSDSNNLISDFTGIAESFGFSDLKVQSSYYIPDIINSYSLKRTIVEREWEIDGYENPINLIQYWKLDNTKSSIVSKFLNMMKSKKFISNKELLNTEKAISVINNLIDVDELGSGLIKVTVYMDNPYLSSDIANYISEYVVDFVESEQRYQANINREFLQGRVGTASLDLSESEEKFTKFLKSHPISIETPEILQEKARLIRNIEVNQQVYITLRQQLEIAKIEELKSRLFINKLDIAHPAISPSRPNKILVLLLMISFGSFFSFIYLLYSKGQNKRKIS